MRRLLATNLILVFLTTPLGAMWCVSCTNDHCDRGQIDQGPAVHEELAHGELVHKEPTPLTHCQQTAEQTVSEPEPKEMQPTEMQPTSSPCDDGPVLGDLSSCCATVASPEQESRAISSVLVSFDLLLESAGPFQVPLSIAQEAAEHRRKPPQQAPQALYTLHSAFLI